MKTTLLLITCFFANIVAIANEPKDLNEALVKYTWSFVNGLPEPKEPKYRDKEVRFFEDGTARSTNPLDNLWHWKLTGTHSVQLVFEEDGFKRKPGVSLVFDPSFLKFSWNGVRITGARLRLNGQTANPKVAQVDLQSVTTDPNQPRIEVIKDQGPNATEWALTPLDEAIPADIRQNLTFLREDLLDEGKKAAKSSPEAYKLASEYCDKLLAALSQREIARVQAGYSAAQADANKVTSNQALDARRNHQMSWPQFSREESQRAALRESETNKADVKKQRLKVDWATRAEQMRQHLDTTYRQLREAMR